MGTERLRGGRWLKQTRGKKKKKKKRVERRHSCKPGRWEKTPIPPEVRRRRSPLNFNTCIRVRFFLESSSPLYQEPRGTVECIRTISVPSDLYDDDTYQRSSFSDSECLRGSETTREKGPSLPCHVE